MENMPLMLIMGYTLDCGDATIACMSCSFGNLINPVIFFLFYFLQTIIGFNELI